MAGPGLYFIGLQSNGTTDTFMAFGNAVEKFPTGTQSGTFGTIPA